MDRRAFSVQSGRTWKPLLLRVLQTMFTGHMAFFFAVGLIVPGAFTSSASAKVREESNALEMLYESRARAALNTLLRPNEYSIVVAVDISDDAKLLSEVEDELDRMGLPGVPGMQIPENMPIVNKLHQLKNRVEVHIVLDEGVSADKEASVSALVRMKLHLDDAAGDNLTIVRSLMIPKEPKPEPPPVETLPELTWRMWALAVVVTLLAISGLLLFVTRRRKNRDEIELKKQAYDEQNLHHPPAADPAKAAAEEAAALEAAEAARRAEEEREAVEFYERKKFISELAVKYPTAVGRSVGEFYGRGNQEKALLAVEAIGWDLSKSLFAATSQRVWASLGSQLAARQNDPEVPAQRQAVKALHQYVVSRYLELIDQDLNNPFDFLTKLSSDEQFRILSQEGPFNLATICVFLDEEQKSDLLSRVSEDTRQAALLQLARLREIPFEAVNALADRLRDRLKEMRAKPATVFDGQKQLVELLAKLDVEAEARFLQRLASEQPQEMAELRRGYLQFEDLLFVPVDTLADAISGVETGVLTAAVAGPELDPRAHLLAALPEKKARLVEKDIAYLKDTSPRAVLLARRELLRQVRTHLAGQGVSVGGLMDSWAAEMQKAEQVA